MLIEDGVLLPQISRIPASWKKEAVKMWIRFMTETPKVKSHFIYGMALSIAEYLDSSDDSLSLNEKKSFLKNEFDILPSDIRKSVEKKILSVYHIKI